MSPDFTGSKNIHQFHCDGLLGLESYIDHVYSKRTPTLKNVFDSYFDRAPISATAILKRSVRARAGQIFTQVGIVPPHQELTLLDLKLARERRSGRDHREETKLEIEKLSIIRVLLDQVSTEYDYVLLDCPPNINLVTQNAFFASDYYLVPAIPDFLSTVGISLIKNAMDHFNSDFQSMCSYACVTQPYVDTKFAGIVFNMADEYGGGPKSGHAGIIENVKHEQGAGAVFKSYVTDGDGVSAAAEIQCLHTVTCRGLSKTLKSKQVTLKK